MVYCVEDDSARVVGGKGNGASPRNLATFTLGDELKIFSGFTFEGRVSLPQGPRGRPDGGKARGPRSLVPGFRFRHLDLLPSGTPLLGGAVQPFPQVRAVCSEVLDNSLPPRLASRRCSRTTSRGRDGGEGLGRTFPHPITGTGTSHITKSFFTALLTSPYGNEILADARQRSGARRIPRAAGGDRSAVCELLGDRLRRTCVRTVQPRGCGHDRADGRASGGLPHIPRCPHRQGEVRRGPDERSRRLSGSRVPAPVPSAARRGPHLRAHYPQRRGQRPCAAVRRSRGGKRLEHQDRGRIGLSRWVAPEETRDRSSLRRPGTCPNTSVDQRDRPCSSHGGPFPLGRHDHARAAPAKELFSGEGRGRGLCAAALFRRGRGEYRGITR